MHSGHLLLKSSNNLGQYLKAKKDHKNNQWGCTSDLHKSIVNYFFFNQLTQAGWKTAHWNTQGTFCWRSWEACADVQVNSEFSKVSTCIKVTVSYSIMHGTCKAVWFNHVAHSFTEQTRPLSNCKKNPFSAKSLVLQGAPQDQDLWFTWHLNATKKKVSHTQVMKADHLLVEDKLHFT